MVATGQPQREPLRSAGNDRAARYCDGKELLSPGVAQFRLKDKRTRRFELNAVVNADGRLRVSENLDISGDG